EKERELFEAIFEFKPSNPDEMELVLGDIIAVTDQMDDGWFRGKNIKNKQTGVFPGNYVKQIVQEIEKEVKKEEK
uniref:SH3 domain-containing protein n=1 Tax=Salmonella sp. s51228 TaxID=3159652 RepID=UPI00397F458D